MEVPLSHKKNLQRSTCCKCCLFWSVLVVNISNISRNKNKQIDTKVQKVTLNNKLRNVNYTIVMNK